MSTFMQVRTSAQWQRLNQFKRPLILALVIHLVFILMLAKMTPAWDTREDNKLQNPGLHTLSVSLQPAPPEQVKPPEQLKPPENEPELELAEVPEAITDTPVNKVVTQPLDQTELNDEKENHRPARLLNSRDFRTQLQQQLEQNRNNESAPRLGVFSSQALPANWTRKAVDYTPGMFKAAELPTKAIILDNWKNPDGSLQNKIKLPNGNVLCGRREAHNPLDIYSMPIWMYHSC